MEQRLRRQTADVGTAPAETTCGRRRRPGGHRAIGPCAGGFRGSAPITIRSKVESIASVCSWGGDGFALPSRLVLSTTAAGDATTLRLSADPEPSADAGHRSRAFATASVRRAAPLPERRSPARGPSGQASGVERLRVDEAPATPAGSSGRGVAQSRAPLSCRGRREAGIAERWVGPALPHGIAFGFS
jgi:hypothetical protein